jgi:hypothetical protein
LSETLCGMIGAGTVQCHHGERKSAPTQIADAAVYVENAIVNAGHVHLH